MSWIKRSAFLHNPYCELSVRCRDVGVGIDIQELQMQDIEDVGLDLDDDIPVWESAHDKTLELTEGVQQKGDVD